MAENNPGQVISPNGDSNKPSDSASRQNQEVDVPLNTQQQPVAEPSNQPPAPEQPADAAVSPQLAPEQTQPSQPAQPAPPPQPEPNTPSPQQQPLPQAAESQPAPQPSTTAAQPASNQVFPSSNPADDSSMQQDADELVSWTASEYVSHHKPTAWYVLMILAALVVTVGVFFITEGDFISTVVVALVMIVFGMYAARKPRVQEYAISDSGVTIGPKTYPFSDLKSFSVIDEGPLSSITFMPLKRFMPMISIYYDPADEDRIVELLAVHLPMEHRGHDPLDRFMKKIRF